MFPWGYFEKKNKALKRVPCIQLAISVCVCVGMIYVHVSVCIYTLTVYNNTYYIGMIYV